MIWNKKNHGLLILAWMYKNHKKIQFQKNYIKNYKKTLKNIYFIHIKYSWEIIRKYFFY